jgi:hypothetical protein
VDETDEATPTLNSDIEADVKELMGLFDLPAFARRGQDVEAAVRRLHERCEKTRGAMLDMVRVRLRQWRGAAAGPESWRGVFTSSIEPLWALAGAAPPRWAESDASIKRRRGVASDLISATIRFNRRWLEALDHLNLEPTNFVIEQYNRYYLLEKECVMGSAKLAARHFTPMPLVSKPTLLTDHPVLPVPVIAGVGGSRLASGYESASVIEDSSSNAED